MQVRLGCRMYSELVFASTMTGLEARERTVEDLEAKMAEWERRIEAGEDRSSKCISRRSCAGSQGLVYQDGYSWNFHTHR